jgi:dGTPase
MRRPSAFGRYERQRDVLLELVEALAARAPEGLDRVFAPLWKDAADDAARLRVVVDQVASLTDLSAPVRHARLTGRR